MEEITWTPLVSGVNQNLHQIKFNDATNGFAVGDNAIILKTLNGGISGK